MRSTTEESGAEGVETLWRQRYATLRAARLRAAAQEAAFVQKADARALVLQVGKQRFALPLAQVSGVVPLTPEQKATPVPGAPPTFWGLLLLRGEVWPVFDLGRLLGTETSSEVADRLSGHVVFVREDAATASGDATVGWKVDRVEEIASLPVPATGEDAARNAGQFVLRLVESTSDAAPLLVLDVSAILTFLRGGSDAAPPPAEDIDNASTDSFAMASIEEE